MSGERGTVRSYSTGNDKNMRDYIRLAEKTKMLDSADVSALNVSLADGART